MTTLLNRIYSFQYDLDEIRITIKANTLRVILFQNTLELEEVFVTNYSTEGVVTMEFESLGTFDIRVVSEQYYDKCCRIDKRSLRYRTVQ